ncbi:MAG: C40 family peptidase [Halofilum sp. (in: g-proteobacteria)]
MGTRLPRIVVGGIALLLLAGCAIDPMARATRPDRETTERVAEIALEMRGQPYRWGGDAPGGFDCSGLVQYAYAQAGLDVPRTSDQQYDAIRQLYVHQLAPGDVVFFRTSSAVTATHVGIYVGDNRFVHALNPEHPVHEARLDKRYWEQRLIAAGSLMH